MELLLIGAGAIGVALAAGLADEGHHMTILAREDTRRAIDSDGVHRTGLFAEKHIPAGVVTTVSDYAALPQGAFDFVLISAKTMANEEISDKLNEHRGCLKEGGKLVLFQNGWGNDAWYRRYFSEEQVCSARVITGFRRETRSHSVVTVHTQPLLLGSLYGCDPTPLEPLAQAIDRSGIPCETSDTVAEALWAKMLYNCTLNPLGAILHVPYGALCEKDETVAIMNDLIDEEFAVMHAAGYRTFWETPEEYREVFYGKLVPDTYAHCSSTLQDLEGKRKTEIATLTGCILSLAKEHGVPVPVSTVIYRMIRGLEAQF
ncbi:MAG: ketopantoate reductase family protein [Eubacteriales bacterium]|nr:ketopantoate reductase family protein [Eubacteriales bacterium]